MLWLCKSQLPKVKPGPLDQPLITRVMKKTLKTASAVNYSISGHNLHLCVYADVDIWLEYCQFIIGALTEPDGAATIRQVFEQAVTAVGLHVTCGHLVWEAYREFENAVLGMMQVRMPFKLPRRSIHLCNVSEIRNGFSLFVQPAAGSVPDEGSAKKMDEQLKRVASIFKRQLCIPSLSKPLGPRFCVFNQF